MKINLIRIIPKSLRSRLHQVLRNRIVSDVQNQLANIPEVEFHNSAIKNTKFLATRNELLHLITKNGTAVELGVDEGNFSAEILNICTPEKLFLIDMWDTTRFNKEKQKSVERRFEDEIRTGKVSIKLGKSYEIAEEFDNKLFDFVYIDTDHSYETTLKELIAYAPKVKPKGLLAGHDFIKGNFRNLIPYGVKEAVATFCNEYDWELLYVTAEITEHPSFAIRRIR